MKCAIFSVGTELLMGQITDTNAVYLSEELRSIGIDVIYRYTVGDNNKRLARMIKDAFRDCDIVISTGGLGPTEDDLTKETLAEVMGVPLKMDERTEREINEHARRLQKVISDNTYKQAMQPVGATIFYNGAGLAPGCAIEKDGKIGICMPGPPREMTSMFENSVRDYLIDKGDGEIYYRVIGIFGKGESFVETDLMDLIDTQTDPTIATYAKEGECTVRVASKDKDIKKAKKRVDAMVAEIAEREKGFVYTTNGERLVDIVGRRLIKDNITISACESCTGGMFAAELTGVPGISEVFDRGLVTYTYDAKMDELGVKEETLSKYTAVSEEVAREMVEGLKEKTSSDVCVSVTGLAGPGGGTKEKPVGLVYVGCIYKDREEIVRLEITDLGRHWIRRYATLAMFNIINKMLDDEELGEM